MSLHLSSYDQRLTYAFELFPYEEPNRAQNKIIQNIVALDDHDKFFLESPTGSGKTIATLISLLSKMKEDEKIIVFTRTVSQMEPILREWGRIYSYQDIVEDTAPLILPILGKARLCKQIPVLKKYKTNFEVHSNSVHMLCKAISCKLHPQLDKNDLYKQRAGRYKLRNLNMKIAGKAQRRSPPIDDVINDMMQQPYCGYYGLRSMTRYADIVIASFPYMKQPLFNILLNSMDIEEDKVHIMIDEAHNLVQSSETVVMKEELEKVKALLGPIPVLKKLLAAMKYNRQINPYDIATDWEYQNLSSMLMEADEDTRRDLGVTLGMMMQPAMAKVSNFLRARNSGKIYTSSDRLKIISPTPIHYLKEMKETKTMIFQSGTFTPIDTYKKLYGFPKAKHLIVEPLRDDQRFSSFLTWKGLTSKFNRRGPVLYSNMSRAVMYLSRISPRHVLIVCPSYDFLESLQPYLEKLNKSKDEYGFEIEFEQDGIDIQKLAYKVASAKEKMLLVGVAGGKISEGVEFVKEGHSLLSTVIFCGLPFRPVSRENMFIRNIIASVAANADIARKLEQQIPIIRLVRQAFGRSIRSDQDYGALIILDFRAEHLLKRELGLSHYKQIKPLLKDLHEFFIDYPGLIELGS